MLKVTGYGLKDKINAHFFIKEKNGIGILLLIPYAVYIQSSSNILFSLFAR